MSPGPRLIVFTDATRADPDLMLTRFSALARRARPGSVLFSLRDYQASARERWLLGQRLALLAHDAEQRWGVADRGDLARALGSVALHLPERGLRAADARRYLGAGAFLSQACHDPDAPLDPELDARVLSPIFEPRKGRPALGLAPLERAAAGCGASIFALGGVDPSNAAACLAAGAAGVAVIGAALAPDPTQLLSSLAILRV